jgi:putative SOS response-associated peptidase YedK
VCGRFTRHRPWAALAALYRLADDRGIDGAPAADLTPRWNIAPGQPVAIVRPAADDDHRWVLREARWGLVPAWAKDPGGGARLINARAETVDRLPSFRAAFRRRRCLVVADGFYEWRAAPAGEGPGGSRSGGKQPYFITLADGRPFAFAGLWEAWRDAAGAILETCTIIVTAANAFVQPLHGRMPVILEPDRFAAWLDAGQSSAALRPLLAPHAGPMTAWPVSTRVNSPRNDDAACLAPLAPAVSGPADRPAAFTAVAPPPAASQDDLFGGRG